MKETVNKDTYQTLKEFKIDSQPQDFKPMWKKEPITLESGTKIFVATPVHSDVSMHYTQAVLMFQQQCMKNDILVSFTLLKSSLVTQGRNLCVAEFLNHDHDYEYLLFIDSDIDFEYDTIMKMIEADKDIISCPYPMKTIDINKMWRRATEKYETIKNELILKSIVEMTRRVSYILCIYLN